MSGQPIVSPLEAKILALVVRGLPAQAIANQLNMREEEIEAELSQIMRSLGLQSRVELILFAFSRGTEKKGAAA